MGTEAIVVSAVGAVVIFWPKIKQLLVSLAGVLRKPKLEFDTREVDVRIRQLRVMAMDLKTDNLVEWVECCERLTELRKRFFPGEGEP
jgi:hypothetical protein